MSYAALSCPIPRRFRRPLLFPPGLLALAWLLCLGCVALPRMPGLYHPKAVVNLTMPVYRICSEVAEELSTERYPRLVYPFCLNAQELAVFRPWQTYSITDYPWSNFFTLKMVDFACRPHNSTSSIGGIRIILPTGARYETLIQLLTGFTEKHIYHTWLDIRAEPTILYAIVDQQDLFPEEYTYDFYGDDTMSSDWFYVPWYGKLSLLFNQPHRVPYFSPDWRNSLLLLLLLGLFSAWRLRRQWRQAAA